METNDTTRDRRELAASDGFGSLRNAGGRAYPWASLTCFDCDPWRATPAAPRKTEPAANLLPQLRRSAASGRP